MDFPEPFRRRGDTAATLVCPKGGVSETGLEWGWETRMVRVLDAQSRGARRVGEGMRMRSEVAANCETLTRIGQVLRPMGWHP